MDYGSQTEEVQLETRPHHHNGEENQGHSTSWGKVIKIHGQVRFPSPLRGMGHLSRFIQPIQERFQHYSVDFQLIAIEIMPSPRTITISLGASPSRLLCHNAKVR